MSLKKKQQEIELGGDTYIVREPSGSELQEIFELQENGKRVDAAFLCLRCCLFNPDGSRGVSTDIEDGDISPSVALTVTQVAMEMVTPKKL